MSTIYFSQNVKLLRKRKGETQSDVSTAIGVEITSYGGYERGKAYPKFETLVKIVEHFHINLHDLVFTDLGKYPNGEPSTKREPAANVQRVITRLHLEIDGLAADVIARANPEDLEGLMKFREELIDKYPETARDLGIEK